MMNQYEKLATIGAGSFGKVVKIRRKSDKKELVWKELNYGRMSEKEKQLLVSEVNILRELRNPFIVRYHDRIVDKASTRLYIVMEYCSGGDLGQVIKRHKRDGKYVDERHIWRVLAQSVVALKECHRHTENGGLKPILHRDIKPANVLLDSNQNIKFGDFGLAKELSSESKLAKTNVGTPFYMSPEIINEKSYDERSDIWSLGCLVYELAALRPPFDAKNQISLAMKINAGRFPSIPKHYSNELSAIISSMLSVDRRRRPKIEDVERTPALQSALSDAMRILRESRGEQPVASAAAPAPAVREDGARAMLERQRIALEKERSDLKQKLEAVERREKDVETREAALTRREKELERATQQHQQALQAAAAQPRRSTRQSVGGRTNAGFTIHVDETASSAQPAAGAGETHATHQKWVPSNRENERPASGVRREAGAALVNCGKRQSDTYGDNAAKKPCRRDVLTDHTNRAQIPPSSNAGAQPVKVDLRTLLARANTAAH